MLMFPLLTLVHVASSNRSSIFILSKTSEEDKIVILSSNPFLSKNTPLLLVRFSRERKYSFHIHLG